MAMHRRLDAFFRGAIWLIAVCLTLTVFLLNVFFHSEVSYNAAEKVRISGHLPESIGMLLIVALGIVLLARFQKQLERLNLRVIFGILSAVYLGVILYVVLNSNNVLRADAHAVYMAALEVKEGIYTALQQGGYIYTYPHQLGLMLYDMLLSCVVESPVFNFFVNAALVLGINSTCCRISRELCQDKLVQLLTLVLSFGFFPQLFFAMFAYGQIPGLFCLLMGFYFALRFGRKPGWKSGMAMTVFTALSILLRNNNLIGAIAIAIYLILQFVKQRQWRMLAAAFMVVVCMWAPGEAVEAAVEAKTQTELDNGCPSVLWLAMGTDIDNRTSGPGWHDATSYAIYMENGAQADAAAAVGWEKLKQNAEKMQKEPLRTAVFFRDKAISQWCEPLYQSIWSGPMNIYGQETYTPLLLSLYGGGKAEDLAEFCAKLVSLLIWGGCCVFVLVHSRKKQGWELMFLYFIGGFLFHTIWEAKSQYVYPYVFCMVPFAACGVRWLAGLKRHAVKE